MHHGGLLVEIWTSFKIIMPIPANASQIKITQYNNGMYGI